MKPAELAERLDDLRAHLVALSVAALHDGDALDCVFRACDELAAASMFLTFKVDGQSDAPPVAPVVAEGDETRPSSSSASSRGKP